MPYNVLSVEIKARQCDKVLEYMRQFGSITKHEALEDLGCKDLVSKISELRHRGIAIGRKTAYGKDRYGNDFRFAKYFLIDEN